MTVASTWHRREAGRRTPALLTTGSAPSLWWLTAGIVSLSIVLGGGAAQGRWSDALVQLFSLALLLAIVIGASARWLLALDRLPLFLLVGLIAIPAVQLIPLPPAVWTALPGRQPFAAAYVLANIDLPWLPLSLDPQRTIRSVLSLVPAIAVFLATLRLDLSARRSLSLLYIALGFVTVLFGLAQLAQGPASSLRFFPASSDAVGFFANRNHYAALLYSLVPLTAAWAIGLMLDRRSRRQFAIAVSALVFAALMLGLGMARSRAGIFLVIPAGLGSLGLAAVSGRRFARYGTAVIAAAWLLGVVLIIQYALFRLLGRFDTDVLTDFRLVIAGVTLDAGEAFQPLGSGLGSFAAVYQIFEPNSALLPVYANHAHNDWLELWLEGGWVAVALLLAFLFWFARASFRVWRAPLQEGHALDRALPQAATITVSLLLLHSAVDYPLRTTAMMTLFGWCCGLLLKPTVTPSGVATDQSTDGQQHHPKSQAPSRWTIRRRQSKAWQR